MDYCIAYDIFLFSDAAITYALKIYSYRCLRCNYESKHPLGTPDMDQTLTDVNTEFAQFNLFVCKNEKKFVHENILDARFDGKCPSDGTTLEEVSVDEAKCPRCGSKLEITELKPLAASDSVTK
jgi:DNA-directed RNA polymerase subunit RPC12/RpoP